MADEIVFSSMKRTYGEYICISAIKYQNMIKEMILKVSLYICLEEWHNSDRDGLWVPVMQQSIVEQI
jgi:hypothetical protein